MDLDAYFERIGFSRPVHVDEETLFALHAAHLAAIPYENLDIQLGHQKRLDEGAFFERIVTGQRGGWCYEMNGLFSAALRQLGFSVSRVGGAVARDIIGDAGIGNHMVLIVDLGRRFVADVGLGDGPTLPFALEEHSWSEGDYHYRLERHDAQWWRFHNHAHGLAPRFDFDEAPRELDWYLPQSSMLQTADASPFLQLALLFRRGSKVIRALRDTTYLEIEGAERRERSFETVEDYRATVGAVLGRDLGDDVDRLWEKVSARAAKRAAAS